MRLMAILGTTLMFSVEKTRVSHAQECDGTRSIRDRFGEVFLLPVESSAQLMPPDAQSGAGMAMAAALADEMSRAFGGLE